MIPNNVAISGDPQEVWLIEYVPGSIGLQPFGEWIPWEHEPALYTLEYNIEKLCKTPYSKSPGLMTNLRIRNVVTGETVPGALLV